MSIRNALDVIYKFFERKTCKRLNRFMCLLIRTILNLYVRFYYKLSATPSLKSSKYEYIVSMTSFPARVNSIWIVIESLLRQTLKPDLIILYLSKKQFSNIEIPSSVKSLEDKGLVIRFVDEDIRSYKKFYYAFLDFPNSNVITVDDDIIYPSDTIEKIIAAHKEYPNSIVARYVHHITRNSDSNLNSYNKWNNDIDKNPSSDIFFGSGGGTLFPVRRVHKDVLDKDKFMSLCPIADDVWLNAYIRLSGFDVYCINDESCSIINVQIKSDVRLYRENCDNSQNDIQLDNIIHYFKHKYDRGIF